jgi:hypothetical protein
METRGDLPVTLQVTVAVTIDTSRTCGTFRPIWMKSLPQSSSKLPASTAGGLYKYSRFGPVNKICLRVS